MADKKGIFDTIAGLFGGDKEDKTNTQTGTQSFTDEIMNMGSSLLGGEGKQILSQLGSLKSLDLSQIQSVLGALGQSADTQVQGAKQDLQSVQHDGESFVDKLKGYLTGDIGQKILPLILPVLQKLFA